VCESAAVGYMEGDACEHTCRLNAEDIRALKDKP